MRLPDTELLGLSYRRVPKLIAFSPPTRLHPLLIPAIHWYHPHFLRSYPRPLSALRSFHCPI